MGLFKSIGRWAKRRVTEKSTIAGVATVLAGVLAPKLGLPLDQTAQIIGVVLGGVLVGATTNRDLVEAERQAAARYGLSKAAGERY
jgi:hypothetical protein